MKLLLVNCPVSLLKPYEDNEPLGILYIAAVLLQKGHNVIIRDFGVEQYEKHSLIKELAEQSYDGLMLSCRTASYVSSLQIISDCITNSFRGFVILGGQHPSALPRETLSEINTDPLFIVRGEGEETVSELLEKLEKPLDAKELEKIQGLSFKIKGAIYHTPDRELIKNIDDIPFPARHLLKSDLYTMKVGKTLAFNLITSRGCPYNCIYCQKNIFKNKIRFRSPENIANEIKELVSRYGRNAFYFVDDLFTADPKRLVILFEILNKATIKIRWRCLSRADKVNAELLKKFKEWGCEKIVFGFESGDSYTLKKVKKGVSTAVIRKAAELTQKAGIRFKANFMCGFPWDNYPSLLRTFHFAACLPVNDEYKIFSVTPFPGTEIWNLYKTEGLIDEHNVDWQEFLVTDYRIKNRNIHPFLARHLIILFYIYVFYIRLLISFSTKANWRILFLYFGKINLKELLKISFNPGYHIRKSVQSELVDYKFKRYPLIIRFLIKGMILFFTDKFSRKAAIGACLSRNYPDEAKKILIEALMEHPDDDKALCELANLYCQADEFEEASKLLKKALEQGGYREQAALLYGFLNSENLTNDKLLSSYLTNRDYLKKLADRYFDEKKFKQAQWLYEKTLKQKTSEDKSLIHRRTAEIYTLEKDYVMACNHYLQAFEMKNEIETQNSIVDVFSLLCDQNPNKAFNFACKIKKDMRLIRKIIGSFLLFFYDIKVHGNYKLEIIKTFIDRDACLTHSLLYRIASTIKKEGDFKNSEKIFSYIAQSCINFKFEENYKGGANYHIGEMLYHKMKYLEALTYFKRCLLLIPDHQKAFHYYKKCIK
jgi:radical SAM superfamily enzyme YgiQ (UPF0313 family)/Tfp pilus assembly protein PilF